MLRSKATIRIAIFCMILLLPFVLSASGQTVDKKQMAERVKAEFLHAWNGYKQYCWGHDDLKPLTKTCRDWYGTPMLMTPVDSLDSLYLLGFKKEADATREYITKNLSFDKDISVQNFEIVIRILGGLVVELSDDRRQEAAGSRGRSRHSAAAGVRFADRLAVQERQSEDGKDERSGLESG